MGPSERRQARRRRKPSPDPIQPVIGTVDIDAVFKGYEKFKVTNKQFQAEVMARQSDLMKLKSEGNEETQMLAKLTPGTADFKRHEDKVTELKARLAAGTEQAQREFQLKESENVATIYKEVQMMVTADRAMAQNELCRPGDECAAGRGRSQHGHGRSAEHDGLLRPAKRHHKPRHLQPQSPIQGGCGRPGAGDEQCHAAGRENRCGEHSSGAARPELIPPSSAIS